METRNSLKIVFVLLSLAYGAGELCQLWFPGTPQWIRWHLSDLGCVGGYTSLLSGYYDSLAARNSVPVHRRKTVTLAIAITMWLACLGFESWQEIRTGSGDLIDAICYTVAIAAIVAAYRFDSRQVRAL